MCQIDFGLNLPKGLKLDTLLTLPIPGDKGLSCSDLYNVALEGPCHVVRASSLKKCFYPQRPILEREVAIAEMLMNDPDVRPSRKRQWVSAVKALEEYRSSPQPPGKNDDQLHWELCKIEGAAEPLVLKHRLFNDPVRDRSWDLPVTS